jgi:hypothetical protein
VRENDRLERPRFVGVEMLSLFHVPLYTKQKKKKKEKERRKTD